MMLRCFIGMLILLTWLNENERIGNVYFWCRLKCIYPIIRGKHFVLWSFIYTLDSLTVLLRLAERNRKELRLYIWKRTIHAPSNSFFTNVTIEIYSCIFIHFPICMIPFFHCKFLSHYLQVLFSDHKHMQLQLYSVALFYQFLVQLTSKRIGAVICMKWSKCHSYIWFYDYKFCR